ncbi:DUF4342 domain-containing protein [Rhodohalobacter sp. 614A]|uniref:DUF4342 domain-containing protein n=1 Tax=Rhodohalobacter sp. 614A TaxID=2908649 RepID=UPI001F2B4A65|nr:DUF4342 domain-containing protein [Rhodohalobacter sp. 614A]
MEKTQKTIFEEIRGTVDEIIAQVKKIIREGNVRRILIKSKTGKTLFQSQLTIGAAGLALLAVYAPLITAISTILLFVNDAKVFIEREVDEDDDEYEVEAEVIEIQDEDEEETKETKSESKSKDDDSESEEK